MDDTQMRECWSTWGWQYPDQFASTLKIVPSCSYNGWDLGSPLWSRDQRNNKRVKTCWFFTQKVSRAEARPEKSSLSFAGIKWGNFHWLDAGRKIEQRRLLVFFVHKTSNQKFLKNSGKSVLKLPIIHHILLTWPIRIII